MTAEAFAMHVPADHHEMTAEDAHHLKLVVSELSDFYPTVAIAIRLPCLSAQSIVLLQIAHVKIPATFAISVNRGKRAGHHNRGVWSLGIRSCLSTRQRRLQQRALRCWKLCSNFPSS